MVKGVAALSLNLIMYFENCALESWVKNETAIKNRSRTFFISTDGINKQLLYLKFKIKNHYRLCKVCILVSLPSRGVPIAIGIEGAFNYAQ